MESPCAGLRFSGDLAMRRGEARSLTVSFPIEQRIEISEAVGRWSVGGSCDGEFSNRAAHPRSTSALFETIGVRT